MFTALYGLDLYDSGRFSSVERKTTRAIMTLNFALPSLFGTSHAATDHPHHIAKTRFLFSTDLYNVSVDDSVLSVSSVVSELVSSSCAGSVVETSAWSLVSWLRRLRRNSICDFCVEVKLRLCVRLWECG